MNTYPNRTEEWGFPLIRRQAQRNHIPYVLRHRDFYIIGNFVLGDINNILSNWKGISAWEKGSRKGDEKWKQELH
jgi:hypothetical protein